MKIFINIIAGIAFIMQSVSFVLNALIQKKPECAINSLYSYFVVTAFFCSVLVVVLFVIMYNFNFKFLKIKILNCFFFLVGLLGTYIHIWQLFMHHDFVLISFVLLLYDIYIFCKILGNLLVKTGNAVKNENNVRRELNLTERVEEKNIMNKLLLFSFSLFTYMSVYANDSILVDKVWTQRVIVIYGEEEMDSIGEGPLVENDGIKCGYAGCIEIEFLSNHRFRKIYPYGIICLGTWNLENDVLTIRYDKRERKGKKRYQFKIKYREKEECPTLYLFEMKGIACYIFCNYKQ